MLPRLPVVEEDILTSSLRLWITEQTVGELADLLAMDHAGRADAVCGPVTEMEAEAEGFMVLCLWKPEV